MMYTNRPYAWYIARIPLGSRRRNASSISDFVSAMTNVSLRVAEPERAVSIHCSKSTIQPAYGPQPLASRSGLPRRAPRGVARSRLAAEPPRHEARLAVAEQLLGVYACGVRHDLLPSSGVGSSAPHSCTRARVVRRTRAIGSREPHRRVRRTESERADPCGPLVQPRRGGAMRVCRVDAPAVP